MFARLILTLVSTASIAVASPPLAESVPAGALAYFEADGLEKNIRALRESELMMAIRESPELQNFMASDDYANMEKARKFAEFVMRLDLWEAAEKILGGEVGLALYPKKGSDDADTLIMVRPSGRFAYMKQRLWLDPLLMVAGKRVLEGPLFETEGIKVWQTKGDKGEPAYVLLASKWFAFSTQKSLLERVIAESSERESLADNPRFAEAAERLGTGNQLHAFIDTEIISKGGGGRLGVPEKAKDAFGSFIAGGITELVANSSYASFGLSIEDGELQLDAVCDGDPAKLPERFRVFFTNPPESGSRPVPQIPELVAGLTIYRDLAEWYQGREEYLQPQVLPAFDKFETGIGNLLPGHDIGEDVLPLFGSNFTLISALQSFDHLEGTPGVQLPSFAMIASLKEPEEATDVLQLLFQTFLSVLNLQAAEQKRQPWLIETIDHEGTKITYARYLDKPTGDDLPTIFNFQPASARVGDEFVFSSSVELCRTLIDSLANSDRTAVDAEDFRISLTGESLTELLTTNREHLEAGQVNKGRDADQAVSDIDLMLKLMDRLDGLQLTTKSDTDGFRLRLATTLTPAPEPEPEVATEPTPTPASTDESPAQ